MNYSQQRNCIKNIVMENPIHPTAKQVYEIARRSYPKISLGTVYRNLNQLAEHGMLKKICSSYGSVRFDGRIDAHFHMVCSGCERVFDVELDEMLRLNDKIRTKYDFAVSEYEISIKGTCGDCLAKREATVV